MEEHKKTDFTKIRKILEKNSSAGTIVFVFLGVFTGFALIFLCTFFIPYMIEDFSIFKVIFFLFWIGLLSVFWFFVFKGRKSEKALLKHIDNGTIIVKRPKIDRFEYYYHSDSDGHSDSGYIVVASDGGDVYKSGRLSNSFFTGGRGFSVDKDYYNQRGIPYSLNDSIYLKSGEYNRVKDVEQQIKALRQQYNYVDEKEKKNLKKEIRKLEEEKISLQPQHLISYGSSYVIGTDPICTDCYIGDEINVFVCPDNPKNYMMEI